MNTMLNPVDVLLEPAHSKFGGSVASRIMHCTGSVRLAEQMPAHLRKSSAFAGRGTALHAAMPRLIERECFLEDLIGERIGDYTITSDDIENALKPVLTWVEALLDRPGAEYFLEHRVAFPTVPGAFGTLDLLARVGNTIHLPDYKFGSGVRVRALSPADDDPAVDIINSQLLFYISGARHSLPKFFAGVDAFILTILQPQSIEPDAAMVSSVEVTHDELDAFIVAYRGAYEESLSESPRLKRGAWCRFCPAKPICPEHTKPLLDLAQFEVPTPAALPSKEAYLQRLAAGLDLFDATKDLRTALHDQAKRALESGDVVPGYELSAGRAERHWRDDESTTIAALENRGFTRDDVVAETMRSPKQVERRAKARGLKIPPELIVSHPSGVSLVRSENARAPMPGRSQLVRSFAVALQALKEGNTYG